MNCKGEQFLIDSINKLTHESIYEVGDLVFKFGHLPENSPERYILEKLIRQCIERWQNKVEALGGEVLGPWKYSLSLKSGEKIYEHQAPQFIELQP